ncbi:unnamed protein product [Ophioblennius macclurei]
MSNKVKKKTRTSFGATAPPFLDYLKEILHRYPDGQILKELLQNADDAQATKVVFVHDERSYGTESLWTDELRKYQGPALYAYNDAAFSDDDWKGIQMAGRSIKRNDPNTVGRFGIGFNSVYHTTDVPGIFSSGHLGLMDPQEQIFGERVGGYQWSFDNTEDQEALMTLHDQFQPFRDIVSLVSGQEWSKVIKEDQYFDGTLFRFPLRHEPSEISDNLYDSDKVSELFRSFIADAELSLLFLKTVMSVSLIHIDVDGVVNVKLEVNCSVPTEVTLESEAESTVESLTRFKLITLKSEDRKATKWLVTTCTMKEGRLKDLDVLANKLGFLPRVDLAFPCGDTRHCSESRLSCFLPLPNNDANKTGLPVHVNACFGLTDNRRHIKWQEEDQMNDEHALWNRLLMKEVLPSAYVTIIQDAIKLAQEAVLPISAVYDLWPDVDQVQHKEKWYAVVLDVFHLLFRQNVALLSLAKDERQFITPSEAVLPCNGPTSPDISSAIRRTLVSLGANIVTLTASVEKAITKAYPGTLTQVTPPFIRKILHSNDVQNLNKEDKLHLLEYILGDGKYQELQGLQMLPVSDGTFRYFTNRKEDTTLIDSDTFPRDLLPFCEHLFIPEDLTPACRASLTDVARQNLFKIINVDANDVAEYTRSFLPQDWKQANAKLATWDIGSSQHPPLDWLHKFWTFLKTHFSELSRFTEIPLIPISPLPVSGPVYLAKLQGNTTQIFLKSKHSVLPVQIAQLVETFGGTVVRENEWLKHEDLDSYVLCPAPRSVMKVMMNLDCQHVIRKLETVSHAAREQLKDYLSHLDNLSDKERVWFSKLPVFQTVKGNCVAAQSKQAVLQLSELTLPPDLPMPDSVILCATEVDRRLLQLLKVNILDTAAAASVLIDCIEKNSCSNKDTEKIMTWILQHGNIIFSQNQTLKRRCKDLRFIETNGELKKPSSFFDCRVETFKVIFEPNYFPPHIYTQTPQMLESLTALGLLNKEEDVSPEHLLHATQMIDKLSVKSHAEALKRAQALFKMLNSTNLLSKVSDKQLQCLKELKWVPCDLPAIDKRHFSDRSQKCCFFCPEEIRHSMFKDIVGHSMPLVENVSGSVSTKLGFKSLPPPEKVMENLSFLTQEAQTMCNPNMNVDFKKQLHGIYKHMQDNLPVFVTVMKKETQWLWNDDNFVSPRDLVLEYPPNLNLSSYVRKMPNEYLPFKKLLLQFGMKTLLSTDDICGILCSIQQTIATRQQPLATLSEVRVAIEILNWLWREKRAVDDDIPVPVIIEGEQFSLKPRSTAVFCDISKNGLKELEYDQEEIYVTHNEIPRATAEWLNIPFLSTHILDPELVGIEQCGQSEPITTRIKNILKEYDEQSDIFKELIQNAEDAGANTCKFLVDFRVHKDAPDHLIDPDMALCQGPCLWAFNNEQFTPEDWKNIVSVGSASKENNVKKIGKFGLGFSTVYHVTDVPSILSGNFLLILDPNVTHLKKHIKHKSNPGIKLNLSQQRLFQCFPGQFGPYEGIFNCNFTRSGPPQPYSGTLIKLPFRNEEEASKSEISRKVYQKHDIVTFHEHFTKTSQTHLLFLKNIDALSLQSLSNNVSTPPRDDEIETLFTVSKTTVSAMRIPDETSVSKQCEAQKSLMKEDGKCQEVIDCCSIKLVQIATQKSSKPEVQSWLLYNCFGTQQALKMALQKYNQAKFSLPIGGVAIPLQRNAETGRLSPLQTELTGQAFCFLPLPIQTGLPVNVNGTFAVTSNRKSLWDSGVKSEWNKALLQDPVVSAYVTALLTLKKMSENGQLETYWYYDFWPDREKVSETFKPLVDAFYFTLSQNSHSPVLFSDGEHWCTMNNAIFLHESIEKNEKIGALAAEMCKKFLKAPNFVVPLPTWLRNTFKKAGLEKALQDRTWNWKKFYQEIVFDNLGAMDQKSRDTLVLHAVDLQNKEIDNLLLQYPCIPTTGGQLQYVKKLVNPSGTVSCLFELQDGRVLGGTKQDFCSPKRIQRLLALGMANEDLPLEDIADKAGTVATTWSVDRDKACVHLKCLLRLMRKHADDENSPHWKRLKETAFLPAFSPGDTKMEKNVKLRRPTDIFSDKCAPLVNMTKPVLDHYKLEIHNTDPVLKVLGVRSHPELDTVLQQVQELSKQSQSSDRSVLHKIATECYRFLNRRIEDSGEEELRFISEWAKSFPFILIGDTFVDISRVAEKEQFQAKPYLHVLPPAFASFRNLWESVGMKKTFTVTQYLAVLQELYVQHGNNSLPHADLSICLTILNEIQNAKEKPTYDCLIPNQQGVLQLASELCFNDSQWIPVSKEVTLCHEKIPRVVACHFGIKTTRHHTLENHVAEDASPWTFQFGQHEELTVRIKNIISAYPSKKDILKELIQNADDAEATEIHFVWDKRQHGKQKTFGKKWNHLQGPALCVFNNRVFTKEDLHGIQQLGEGGKQNSAGKTGKYGVGFNSVFHLTDCPSILTGDEKLCISDPNQKYIEQHSDKPQSGIGYRFDDDLKNMYIDVYNSFLPDNFPLKDGTMFRLPLRMGINANSSKISTQAVTDKDMEELCSALSEDPEGLILFLKNICKIVVQEINVSGKLKTLYTVEKKVPKKNKAEQKAFAKHLQQALQQSDEPVAPHKAFYETVISTSDERKSTWIVAEQFGSFQNASKVKPTDKLPQAALAARVKLKPRQLIPKEFTGQSFCTLPLPGHTGLPVHVNGNFEVDAARRNLWKEDGQSLKTNWNETLKQDVIAPLYADLLHRIRLSIPGKNIHLERFEVSSYLCFWPTVSENVGKDWHEMIHGVYRAVKDKKLDVIPVMRTSVRTIAGKTIKDHSYEWCNITETEPTKRLYLTQTANERIDPILEDLGMKLVPHSVYMDRIWANFKSAGVEVKKVTPDTVRNFIRRSSLNDPTQTDEGLPLPITDTLIKDEQRCSVLLDFCLKDFQDLKKVTKEHSTLLDGLPLLLTSDKVLRVFNSNFPKEISGYEAIFLNYQDQFADYKTNGKHLVLLQTLNLVTPLTVPHAVRYIEPLIQCFLTECEVDPCSGLYVPNQTLMKWLKYLWMFFISKLGSEQNGDDKKDLTLSDVRKLLSDCCIVPVVCPRLNNKHFLQTMKEMSNVIFHATDKDITSILFKLGFMKLNSAFFIDFNRQTFSHLSPELLDVNDKSSVLDQIYNICPSEFSHLSSNELKELQSFLQSGAFKNKISEDYKKKLKSLPLFETTHKTRIRIDGPNKVYVLNSTHVLEFPDLFIQSDDKSIFLKNTPENINLAQILELQILNDAEYFMKFILPALHRLTERQLVQGLKLLLSLDLKENQHHETISSLKTVRLIRSSQGRMELASYYFDDSVSLYQKMLPPEKFVPENFWNELCDENVFKLHPAKDLIKKLGMKHVVSKDDLINFAHQLESDAAGSSNFEELRKKSSLLLEKALEHVKMNKDQRLLQSLADIKFVFPEKIRTELQDYHQPFATERTPVKIRGSLISSDPEHQALIWTSMPIIAAHTGMSPKLWEMINNVGAHKQPPSHYVTTNMRNICQSPCTTDQLVKTRAKVFRCSYTHLQANGFEEQQLAGIPLVLVEKDTKLLPANAVCYSLPFDLEFRPYLYKIPPEDIKFQEFFSKVGVENEATVVQYCNVLREIHADSCDKQQLNPNQQKTVKRAVEQLFKSIQNEGNQALIDQVEILYLPAVDGKLHQSSTLFYNDTVFEVKRLEDALENKVLLLQKLSKCYLGNDTYAHHQLLQLLPPKFQPKMLSGFTEEKAVEELMELCEVGDSCEFRGWFERHLSSAEFRYGLICLIRQQSQGKITQEAATDVCDTTFGSIQIICCKTLETKLWLGEEELDKTASETEVFVKRGQREGCIFYLKHSDDLAPKVLNGINMILTKEINSLLGNNIAPLHLPVLGQLLMCDDLQDVQKALAQHGIHESTEAESVRLDSPDPGTDIPEEWHDSLDMDMLNNFEEGEFVGYSMNGKYVYAIIIEEVPGHSGQLSKRYKIDIGEMEPLEVSCLDLYQFKRETEVKSAGLSCMNLVLLEGAVPHHSPRSTRDLPTNLEEAKREIDKYLAEIWTLPEAEKQKAIKRLYLRWHPDKNPNNEFLTTEAFKYLLQRIEELTTGRTKGGTAGPSYSSRSSGFSHFYQGWNQEARYHRNNRGRFSRGFHFYNRWAHNRDVPRPNKTEAQRWCQQARCDLNAASNDINTRSTEWCLFKVHQAVEKALVAAEYKRNGRRHTAGSISAAAVHVSRFNPQLRDLPQIVEILTFLGVDPKKTQYPNCHRYPHIPNTQFKSENGIEALCKAKELLDKVERYCELK